MVVITNVVIIWFVVIRLFLSLNWQYFVLSSLNSSEDRAQDTPLTIASNNRYHSSDTLACHHKNVTCVLRIHVRTRHSYAHSKAPFTLTTAREMPAHPLDSSLQIVSSIVDSWMSKDWSPTDFFLSLHWISQWYYRYRSTME